MASNIGRFEICRHRDFLPRQVFYSSDRTRRDEQKPPYNLPSKVPVEFSEMCHSEKILHENNLSRFHNDHVDGNCSV